MSQVKFIATKISMSQQTAQLATRTRKEILSRQKKILSRHRKLCRDRVDKLKRKMLVATVSRDMSVKRTGCNKFGVTTQDIPIATRTRQLHQNYVVIESKNKPRKQVATENCLLQ